MLFLGSTCCSFAFHEAPGFAFVGNADFALSPSAGVLLPCTSCICADMIPPEYEIYERRPSRSRTYGERAAVGRKAGCGRQVGTVAIYLAVMN